MDDAPKLEPMPAVTPSPSRRDDLARCTVCGWRRVASAGSSRANRLARRHTATTGHATEVITTNVVRFEQRWPA